MDRRRACGGCFATGLFGNSVSERANHTSRKGAVLIPIIEEVTVTGSTNADLLSRAASGAEEGLWLRADRQTGGRGRLGREWISPDGNIYASCLVRLRPDDPPAASLAFVAAVAVYDALQMVAPATAFQIKWPNDILSIEGEKICGILLERCDDAVIIGMGVNLTEVPEGLDRPVTSLRRMGISPPLPQSFVEILADLFASQLQRWRELGLEALFAAWQERAHPTGTVLFVQSPDGERIEGVYDGLSRDGALRLRLADGSIRAIHAADVFLV